MKENKMLNNTIIQSQNKNIIYDYAYYQFESKRLSVSGSTIIIDGGKKKVNVSHFNEYVPLLEAVYSEMEIPCTLNIHNDIIEIVSEAYQSCKRQKEEIDFNKPLPTFKCDGIKIVDITENGDIRIFLHDGKLIYNPSGLHTRYYLDEFKSAEELLARLRSDYRVLISKEEKVRFVDAWNQYQSLDPKPVIKEKVPTPKQYMKEKQPGPGKQIKFGLFELNIAAEIFEFGKTYKELSNSTSLDPAYNRFIYVDVENGKIIDTYEFDYNEIGPLVKHIYTAISGEETMSTSFYINAFENKICDIFDIALPARLVAWMLSENEKELTLEEIMSAFVDCSGGVTA